MTTHDKTEQHRIRAAEAIFNIDIFWAETFADTDMRDLNYCDLLSQLWIHRHEAPKTKTELYELMPNISRRTAVKYVQKAIEQGFLAETPCETDRRIRLITLTPMALEKIEVFLDYSSRCFLAVQPS
ncbi:MAG: hypothetical protein AB7C96_03670 [Hydrogenovibrio sp.]